MSLFDKNAKYTTDASKIDIEFHQAMKPIFAKYRKTHSPREISHLAMLAVFDLELDAVLEPQDPNMREK